VAVAGDATGAIAASEWEFKRARFRAGYVDAVSDHMGFCGPRPP
jgi:hypothetical protein